MNKKILNLALCVAAAFTAGAQMPQLTPLPLNPKVKSGVLPNGLSYYIMHNEEPKERANFYIAQKVGSTLETQEQLGLAHFLEHMAFNGTKNYPGKSMLNYLMSKGIRFGADINAYTDFDETVYNINNVPTTDKPLMDSVLLVLHDWSCDILLEEAEIDAERDVIQEEWRTRNDANFRMYSSILPKIFEEYQYEQMPIGKMEIVMNFKPEALRAYYKKWYRPDQQGIVIVGDFDADEMEKKVVDLFSTIPMPENAAERVYPNVSDNKEPIYASFTDPELRIPRTTISFKSDKVPFEMRNTVQIYANQMLLQQVIAALINNRLVEAAQSPDCKFASAGVYFSNFYFAKTKDSFNIVVIPKNGTQVAVAEVMGIVARACKTGFTESELDRVRDEITSRFENSYNERDKTNNSAFGEELCRFFIDNIPAPGIEKEFEIVKQVLPMIPVQAINQVIPSLLTSENMVVVTTEPQKEGFEVVAEDVMIKTVTDAMNAQYVAYVDEVITEPLISNLPTPVKIKDAKEGVFGTYEFNLPNGVKVVVKPTDFAADEITLNVFREGGKRTYEKSQAADVILSGIAFSTSKMGPFDNKTLTKYLAGKNAGVGFAINNFTDILSGYSTVKDLNTLMELVYTSFTALNPDPATYKVTAERVANSLKNSASNPSRIFSEHRVAALYPGNPLMENINIEMLEKADYDRMLALIHDALSNAADYTFIFTGNVDIATLKPLLEQYVATLPSGKKTTRKTVTSLDPVRGIVTDVFTQPMQTPSTSVFDSYSGSNVPFTMKNYVMVSLMGDILDNIFTNTLREEEGGTYGASVGGFLNPTTKLWSLNYVFQTNKDKQATLIKRAYDEYMKLLNEGANAEEFNKAREAMMKQYEIEVRKNNYWSDNLLTYLRGTDMISDHKSAIESVTLEELNKFMKGIYDGKNRVEVVMEGIPAE